MKANSLSYKKKQNYTKPKVVAIALVPEDSLLNASKPTVEIPGMGWGTREKEEDYNSNSIWDREEPYF